MCVAIGAPLANTLETHAHLHVMTTRVTPPLCNSPPQKQGSYNVQKQSFTESLGSGRHIPLKEGNIKKKSSGMRPEWKKKYLVLSETEITYYPSLTVGRSPVVVVVVHTSREW